MSGTANTYYCRYFLGDDTLIGNFSAVSNTCKVIAMIVVVPLMLKFLGKRNSLIIACLLIVGANFSRLINPYSVELNYVISGICGFSSGFTYTCLFAMIPDCIEYSEYRDGERGGLGILISSMVMDFSGYVNGAETQTDGAMNAILMVVSVIPPAMFLIAAVALVFYRLDKIYDQIVHELKQRHMQKINQEAEA